jgi:hypothetical protein
MGGKPTTAERRTTLEDEAAYIGDQIVEAVNTPRVLAFSEVLDAAVTDGGLDREVRIIMKGIASRIRLNVEDMTGSQDV